MIYCTKCGKQNADEAKFCTGCGATIQNAALPPAVQPQGVSKTNMRVLIAAVTLLGLGVAAWLIFFNKSKVQKGDAARAESISPAAPKGKYPYTSDRVLTGEELSNMLQEDLRIMRNEIFARHGLIFKSADMRNYFMSQPWYTPLYNNVLDRMSQIEKDNAALIKRYEKYNDEYYGDYAR